MEFGRRARVKDSKPERRKRVLHLEPVWACRFLAAHWRMTSPWEKFSMVGFLPMCWARNIGIAATGNCWERVLAGCNTVRVMRMWLEVRPFLDTILRPGPDSF